MSIDRAQETPLARKDARAHKVEHHPQRFGSGGTPTLRTQGRSGRAQLREIKPHIATVEPGLQTGTEGVGPPLSRVFNDHRARRDTTLATNAWEVFYITPLDREADTTTTHRDAQRFHERVNALYWLVGAVVDRNIVAPSSRTSHRQQAHRRHRTHLENGAPNPIVGGSGQAVTGQLVQEGY